jgi:hypothetical protein
MFISAQLIDVLQEMICKDLKRRITWIFADGVSGVARGEPSGGQDSPARGFKGKSSTKSQSWGTIAVKWLMHCVRAILLI